MKLFKSKTPVNVIIDISGSISRKNLDALSDFLSKKYTNIVTIFCDHEIRLVSKGIESIDNFNRLGGGTILQEGLDYIINDVELKKNNTLIFTDGYTDPLNFTKYNKNVTHLGIKNTTLGIVDIVDLNIKLNDESTFNTIILPVN